MTVLSAAAGAAPSSRGRELPLEKLLAFSVVLLAPVYLFDSGLPQPDDMLQLALAVLLFARLKGRLSWPWHFGFGWLVGFVWYVLLVSFVWSLILGLSWKEAFFSPGYYLFNAIAVLTWFTLYRRIGRTLLSITQHAACASLLVQVLVVVTSRTSTIRALGSTNSPNQLAHYALVAMVIVALCARETRARPWYQGLAYASGIYLLLVSASWAAIAAVLTVVPVVVLRRPLLLGAAGGLFFAGLLLFPTLSGGETPSFLSPFEDRLNEKPLTEQTDLLTQRGYDRILNNPEYLAFGAGEVSFGHFRSYLDTHEMHSSLGTVFFAYGLVGLGFFGMYFIQLFRRVGVRNFIYVVPPFVYGVAHQGLRFTLFWIMLAVLMAVASEERVRARARRHALAAA